MTEPTRVQFETLPPVRLYVPGPRASKAGCILDRIRDLATDGRRFMRYASDAGIDPIALEVIEEALHKATRPMRRGLEAHNHRQRVELQAREFGVTIDPNTPDPDAPGDNEESTHETARELEP